MTRLTVRPASGEDVPDLLDLEAAAFAADAWGEGVLRDALSGSGRRAVVAQADEGEVAGHVAGHVSGHLAGHLAGYAVSRVAGDVVDLERIVVRPDLRRRGVAGVLLADLLAHAGGADRMLLEVSAANTGAVAFYARHGFSQIDERPRYYRDGTAALVLRRGLAQGCGGHAPGGAIA